MSERLASQLQSLGVGLQADRRVVQVADGRQVEILATLHAPLVIRGCRWLCHIPVVKNLTHQLILGVNTLRMFNIAVDFGQDIVTVDNDTQVPFSIYCMEQPDEVVKQNFPQNLSTSERLVLHQTLDGWKTKFNTSPGCTDLISHKLYLEPNVVPLKQRYYPVNPIVQKQIDQEVDVMLRDRIIEPSDSPWSSPILLIPKKDGGKRFVVDMRKVNQVTRKDSYPIPFITTILDSLKNSKYISSLDLYRGYWQINLEKESRPITAFTVPGKGLFQFTRMPFGLHSSGATFQRLMEKVLAPVLHKSAYVYLDDIILVSDSFDSHIQLLNQVFNLLFRAGLKVNWDKSFFCQSKLRYLGHLVGDGKLEVDPEKVRAAADFPTPTKLTELRSFLGFSGWYRRFVDDYSQTAAPLTKLLKKGSKWTWGEAEQQAFFNIKQALVRAPVLSCPDYNHEFNIESDASNVGLGGVLTQNIDGETRLVAYCSRKLTPAETNYSTTEKEALAILFCISKFKPYIDSTHFTIITDNSALKWLFNIENPSGRLARWICALGQYNFTVVYRKGCLNQKADALSRHPVEQQVEVEALDLPDPQLDWTNTTDPWYINLRESITADPTRYPSFVVHNDLVYKAVKSQEPGDRPLLVVPSDFRQQIFELCHSDPAAAHLGFAKTLARVQRFYYWPRMQSDIKTQVSSCKLCQQYKPVQNLPAGKMSQKDVTFKPWSIVATDVVGPLPRSKSGHKYILVFVDTFTKWTVAVPMRAATGEQIAKNFLQKVIFQWGCPDILLSDNASNFTGKTLTSLCRLYNVKSYHTPLYHPAANPAERVNRNIKVAISIFAKQNQRDWDVHLPHIVFALNTSVSESTGLSPAMLNFARELRGPNEPYRYLDAGYTEGVEPDERLQQLIADTTELCDRANKSIQQARARQAHYYNLRRREVHYELGDMVWRKNYPKSSAVNYESAKLSERYLGPFIIQDKHSDTQFTLKDINNKQAGVWHVQDLKPFI